MQEAQLVPATAVEAQFGEGVCGGCVEGHVSLFLSRLVVDIAVFRSFLVLKAWVLWVVLCDWSQADQANSSQFSCSRAGQNRQED